MLGDFRYCSSDSEGSDTEIDAVNGNQNRNEDLEKLISKKNDVEKSIETYQKKLKSIQKSLKQLQKERKDLLGEKNEILKSHCQTDIGEKDLYKAEIRSQDIISRRAKTHDLDVAIEPLNLATEQIMDDNEEEFDSDAD